MPSVSKQGGFCKWENVPSGAPNAADEAAGCGGTGAGVACVADPIRCGAGVCSDEVDEVKSTDGRNHGAPVEAGAGVESDGTRGSSHESPQSSASTMSVEHPTGRIQQILRAYLQLRGHQTWQVEQHFWELE